MFQFLKNLKTIIFDIENINIKMNQIFCILKAESSLKL